MYMFVVICASLTMLFSVMICELCCDVTGGGGGGGGAGGGEAATPGGSDVGTPFANGAAVPLAALMTPLAKRGA